MKKLYRDIINAALKINEKTKHNVFIYIHPHVSLIDVWIYEGGWKPGPTQSYGYNLYYDNLENILEAESCLTKLKTYLENKKVENEYT